MEPLLNVIVRHQIYLEGLKAGRTPELTKTLAKLDRELKTQLAFVKYENLGDMSRTAINRLVIDLKRTSMKVFDVYLSELIRWLEEYCQVDEDFFKLAYSLRVPEKKEAIEEEPDGKSLFALIAGLPMGANGIAMLAFLKAYGTLATAKIGQAVLMAYVNGETKQELIKRISGSPELKNRDGLLTQLQRQGQAVTNTVTQHLAANISSKIASAAFEKYIWVSVIDDATTKICLSRNGKVFFIGRGPVPPAHVGCRSSVMPWDGSGPVPDVPTFRMWAQSQSDAFIKDAFDGKPPSSYEGSSPLTLAEFKGKRVLILG